MVNGTESASARPSLSGSCSSDRSRGTEPSVSSVVGNSNERARSSGVNIEDEALVHCDFYVLLFILSSGLC